MLLEELQKKKWKSKTILANYPDCWSGWTSLRKYAPNNSPECFPWGSTVKLNHKWQSFCINVPQTPGATESIFNRKTCVKLIRFTASKKSLQWLPQITFSKQFVECGHHRSSTPVRALSTTLDHPDVIIFCVFRKLWQVIPPHHFISCKDKMVVNY